MFVCFSDHSGNSLSQNETSPFPLTLEKGSISRFKSPVLQNSQATLHTSVVIRVLQCKCIFNTLLY